ncbi:MAG: 3'(2'),5'-bisphosphate nucleotidase CysQ [Bauldia sp.]|nr:3'(2'),5'-bisphosphate nucleotidase CysQ [Bauldia sp.]
MLTATQSSSDLALIRALLPAVLEAGNRILAIREAGHAVELKADSTPVTEADRAAEAIILAALAALAPGLPVIAEEEAAAGRLPPVGADFVLVDPLDGTKEFVAGNADFTVNVGLARNGRAVAGIVHAPASGLLWFGAVGEGAWRVGEGRFHAAEPIAVREPLEDVLDIVASRSHRNAATDTFLARFAGSRIVSAGSSLKFVAVAEGRADLYPRLGPTSQWDTAAGDAVLRAAGGRVLRLDGTDLTYGPLPGAVGAKAFLNPSFVATGPLDPFAA